MKRYIVVPEGLAADKKKTSIHYPSYCFVQVLEYLISIVKENDIIYLAPGNHFDSGLYEQEVAYKYLISKNVKNKIVFKVFENNKEYFDTWDNAKYLKKYFNDDLKRLRFQLVCEKIHSIRAEFCFKTNGYNIEKVHRIYYQIFKENISGRIFHQKSKIIHLMYEILALIRDIFLFPSRKFLQS